MTGSAIKPIETFYKGYRFRSRLEARWAVFMDTAGWEWAYEIEGFETSGGRYLPDFRVYNYGADDVPNQPLWMEVKPRLDGITDAEARKMQAFGQMLIITDGAPNFLSYALVKGSSVFTKPKPADVRERMLAHYSQPEMEREMVEYFKGDEAKVKTVKICFHLAKAINAARAARFER